MEQACKLVLFFYVISSLYSCEVLNNSSKYNFVDGYYFSRLNTKKAKKYYVVAAEDSIKVYPAFIAKKKQIR